MIISCNHVVADRCPRQARYTLNLVDLDTSTALLAGGFALAGVLGGALFTGLISRSADQRRLVSEDARRWLSDRRAAYARFLGMSEVLHREIDRIGIFLPSGGKPADPESETVLKDELYAYYAKWEDSLQPLLGEVTLLASPAVADLADRVSGALMAVTAPIELREDFNEYYPVWFQARDLIHVLRDAMRNELGLPAVLDAMSAFPRQGDWPWLEERPPREAHIQGH